MATKEYISVGKIAKAHGIKGDLKVSFSYSVKPDTPSPDHLLVETSSGQVPYFIEQISFSSASSCRIKFEEINSREEAQNFSGREIYLTKDEAEEFLVLPIDPLKEIIGFSARDKKGQDIGKVADIIDLPTHRLLQLDIDGEEVLVPVVENTLVSVDMDKSLAVLDLPDGLLDVYLT